MGGEIKVLEFSEGEDTLAPPSNVFIGANSTLTFPDDASYVAGKGSPAAFGDFYGNSTTGKIRQFNGVIWLDLNSTLNNFTAIIAPTVNDDSGDNYSIGSLWLDTVLSQWYIAIDVTVGAAVWAGFLDKTSAQVISGAKTFSAITTFSNTTQSTSKDTGCAVFEGGVGIEKDTYIGGNLRVLGDAQIAGTTTIVNSTNMEVADANITLNKGGNQLAADDTAGFKVEMSDATHAQVVYDKDATSKFKAGEVGTEKEIATISDSQTLTNKTITGAGNTISGLAHGTQVDDPTSGVHGVVGTVVGTSDTQSLSNKSLDDSTTLIKNTAAPTKIARIEAGSITAGQTRVVTIPDMDLTLLGTSTTQTVTNKLLDGGTASVANLWKLPGDTLANLTALARVAKAVYYDETNNKIVYDDGATLNPIGGGGAGGGISMVWRNDAELAAIESTRFNQFCYEFSPSDTQNIYTSIKVPTGYTAGKQIVLKLKIASPTGSDNVLFTAVSTLIRNGVDALSSVTNQRTSTNTAQAIAAVDFEYEIILDITSAIAQINAVAISPMDTILIQLTRGIDTNADIAYFIPSTAEIYITP